MKVHELDKPGNAWCKHCRIGAGCQIYDNRPASCQEYECVWLKSQRFPRPLPVGLRPDKSKVVIGTINNGDDVVLYVTPDRRDAWNKGEFRKLVTRWQSKGMSIFTSCEDVLRKI